MVLRADQQQPGDDKLGRERQLQRPDKTGHDQQPGQAEYEMENQVSPTDRCFDRDLGAITPDRNEQEVVLTGAAKTRDRVRPAERVAAADCSDDWPDCASAACFAQD
jgi:hypothetical protein